MVQDPAQCSQVRVIDLIVHRQPFWCCGVNGVDLSTNVRTSQATPESFSSPRSGSDRSNNVPSTRRREDDAAFGPRLSPSDTLTIARLSGSSPAHGLDI